MAVSVAINSQALCSSLDRLKFHRVSIFGLDQEHTLRWATLTLLVGITAYFIANAVPFFKDLVALIGALTSVPLTLLLPGIYHRKAQGLPLFCLDSGSIGDITSLSLIIFSCIFLICGVIGSISSIQADWADAFVKHLNGGVLVPSFFGRVAACPGLIRDEFHCLVVGRSSGAVIRDRLQ